MAASVCQATKLYFDIAADVTPAFIGSVSSTLLASVTYEIWVLSTAEILATHTLFELSPGSVMELTNTTASVLLSADLNGDVFTLALPSYQREQWFHVAFVHDQSTGMTKIYLD